MTNLLAKDFNNRQELEAKVSSLMGLTADQKPDYTIKGTRKELKRLYLGHGATFWGIRVDQTDYKKPKKTKRVNRGKIHKPKLGKMNIKGSKDV